MSKLHSNGLSSISRFFQPKSKDTSGEGKLLRPPRERDVIVLDDSEAEENGANYNCRRESNEGSADDLVRNPESISETPMIALDGIEEGHVGVFSSQKGSSLRNTSSSIDKDGERRENDECRKLPYTSESTPKASSRDSNQKPSMEKSSRTGQDNKENPFAKYSYDTSVAAKEGDKNLHRQTLTRRAWTTHSFGSNNKRSHTKANGNKSLDSAPIKRINCSTKEEKKKEKTFVKMKDVPPEEQARIVRKWHSLADPAAPLEVRRYQVLVAARLHARCQEPTVRKAMGNLRDYFWNLPESKTITVEGIARMDPELLASHVSNLQFYNAKAKQVVKAAQELLERHNGMVPEDEFTLLQITGIGKTFADLLAFVNTRNAHEQYSCDS